MHAKRFSRRHFLAASTLATVGGVLGGCAQATPVPGAPTAAPAVTAEATVPAATTAAPGVTQIEYWHGWTIGFEKDAIDKSVALFNEAHPEIQVKAVDSKTGDSFLTAVSGGNPPDAGTSWAMGEAAQWRAQDVIMDCEELVKGAGISDELFVTASIEGCKSKGRLHGLPVQMDALAIYYNKDIFKKAVLDPEKPPETMEEMFQMADKLTEFDDAGNISQLGFSGGYLALGGPYMYDGRWVDNAGQPTANDPGNVAAWNVVADYYKKVGAEKIQAFNSQKAENPLGSLFLAGKVAIAFDGDWVINFLNRFAPDMDWGLIPLPPAAGKDQNRYSAPIDQCVYCIPTGSKHPAEAWEMIRWMATTKEPCCIIQKGMATCAALLESVNDAECWISDRFAFFKELISHDKLRGWPTIAVSSLYQNETFAAFDRVTFGKQTAQEALDELQAKIVDELAKAGG